MTEPSKSVQHVHDSLLELEERLGLWELKAAGHSVWHHLRYDVYNKALADLGLMGHKHGTWRDRSLRQLVQTTPRALARSATRHVWGKLTPVDLLVFNHPRHVQTAEGWVCPYTEPLLREAPYTRWVIEQGFQGRHYDPNPTVGVKYLEWEKFKGNIDFYIKKGLGLSWVSSAEQQTMTRAVRQIRKVLGGGPSDDDMYRLSRDAVRHEVALTAVYERLLDLTAPKAILNVVHYSFRNLVMTRLARRRGIPVVELQHGFIGRTHLAYNFSAGRRPETFPDYFLLFGPLWRAMTPGLPLPQERTPPIGYQHLESLRASSQTASSRGKRRVLFVSQGSIGEGLSRLAADVARSIDRSNLEVFYKLHPSELASWRSRYPALVTAPLTVIENPAISIYELFGSSEVQVGVYSTALFEGLAFGLRTFIADLPGSADMAPLIEAGLAELVGNAAQLSAKLQQETFPFDRARIDDIWTPQPGERFRAAMQHILG